MAFAAIAAAFLLALLLRERNIGGMAVIPLAALLVPLELTVEAFVYPAQPEARAWWPVAVLTGTLYGGVTAALGYALVAVSRRRRG